MRVSVQYSVELEDVLEEVQQLYQRERAKLEDKLEPIERSLDQKYTDKNLREISLAVGDYRYAIASFDIKLKEMANILNGYNSVKEELRNPTAQSPATAAETQKEPK